MGTRLIVLGLLEVTDAKRCLRLLDCGGGRSIPGNSSSAETVPETDTGGLVEHTKALERTMLKELGNLPPKLRDKEALCSGNRAEGAQTRGWRLFSKNTGLCEVARRRIGSDACPVPEG